MIIELTIDRLTNGGRGCGRHAGKTIFVPLCAPGDVVRCRITREKKRFAEAELIDVLQPGPERIAASCPFFGDCGGCQWQHLPYSTQLASKGQIFADLLERQAGVDRSVIGPALTAPEPWHYRGRAQFKCRQTAQGLLLGFYRSNSHQVIDIDTCPVLASRLNHALTLFRDWLTDAPAVTTLSQLDLEVGADERLRAVLHATGREVQLLIDYLQPLCTAEGMLLSLRRGPKAAPVEVVRGDDLFINVDGPPLELRYAAGGFVQVNQEQNRRMVAEVLAQVGELSGKRVLDLYCGIGNFSLPLARRAASVVGVEDYAPAITAAKANAARAGLVNADFYARDAAGAASLFWQDGFDLVVLDPPRAGAVAAVAELVKLRPAQIAYVSCDPATLARDLKVLLDGGYRLVAARVIDMFPQTFHLESVSVLEFVGQEHCCLIVSNKLQLTVL